jgi:hypothetical protein
MKLGFAHHRVLYYAGKWVKFLPMPPMHFMPLHAIPRAPAFAAAGTLRMIRGLFGCG